MLALLTLLTTGPVHAGEVSAARSTLEVWSETYGIERPWDALPEMSDDDRRHRGALAYVLHRLGSGEIPREAVGHLYSDLGSLLTLADPDEVLEYSPEFTDYQTFFEIDIYELWKRLITGADVPAQWGSAFREAYYSQADGVGVTFGVRLPPATDGGGAYPMVVILAGGPNVDPSHEFPFIQVVPSRGGVWGYRSISGYDAMQVIAFMTRHYPVDPDRISLTGLSAGASASMHLASSYPDVFAAVLPMVAMGTDYPLANFRNLPVALHHGTEDWVSSVCNARVQVARMQELGCPVVLTEYPGVGHLVPEPHEPLVSWLLANRRNRSPVSIAHECETPALGRSYWLHIREFVDPHRRASVTASVDTSNGRALVRVQPSNVAALAIDVGTVPGATPTVEIGRDRLTVEAATRRLDCRLHDDRWQVASAADSVDREERPYQAGAAANVYQGEPLLIVFGTGSAQASRRDLVQAAAKSLAAFGGPASYRLRHRFPVVADTALTPEQEANCNLILVGIPRENAIARAILSELPIALENDILVAAERSPLPLENQVLSFLYPHPGQPDRLIYLVAPFLRGEGLARFAAAPQWFLVGSDGFDRVSQADLTVQSLDNLIGRQMQFGRDWKWITTPGGDTPIPDRYADRTGMAISHMEIMKRRSGADFSLWWGPADEGVWGYDFNTLKRYNPDLYTQADFATQHRLYETMIGSVSGRDLEAIWNRWGRNGELLSIPEVQVDELVGHQQYRVHIPMDLYIKLGQRGKALDDPEPGPTVSSEAVMAEIFR